MRARNARAALATVIAEGFFGRLAFGMLSFAFPLYARSLGLSLAEIGVLVSLRSVVVLPLKPVAGWLADRVGLRSVYIWASFARTLAAVWLIVAGDFFSLALVRILQGASGAGRDVASLGVVTRDAEKRVASAYSWYATAKHVGGVAGAAIAGIIITATGGSFRPLLGLVAVLSILPVAAAWVGLRETAETEHPEPSPEETAVLVAARAGARERLSASVALLREIAGPASVGMLVAASAYMVHGIFPVLATEYAELTAAQAGIIYTLSAVVFIIVGPLFGWLSDRRGRTLGVAWRSVANIGSSVLYIASPTFAGIALARAVDDSGKAAFRPAWASVVADIAASDPRQRGRRIGALDTAGTIGEVIGPALAGVLWQTGGIVALFAVRIALALAAEIAAIKVFGDLKGHLRPSPMWTAFGYLAPPATAFGVLAGWFGAVSAWGTAPILIVDLVIGGGVMLLGVLLGALSGRTISRAERRQADRSREDEIGDQRHDIRKSLTVIRGEVELILGQRNVSPDERLTSAESVIEEVERIDALLGGRHRSPEVERSATRDPVAGRRA